MNTQRNSSIDSVRFLGFVAVVLLHAVSQDSKNVNFASIADHLTRWAVPVYFIISGYFLENSNRPAFEKWKRTALRLLAIFIFWELIYNIANVFLFGETFRFSIIRTLQTGGVAWHLWFLTSLGVCITIFLLLRVVSWSLLLSVSLMLFLLGLLIDPYSQISGFSWVLNSVGVESGQLSNRDGPFFGTIFVALGAFIANREKSLAGINWWLIAVMGLVLQVAEAFVLWNFGEQLFAPHDYLFGTLPFGVGVFMLLNSRDYPPILGQIGRFALGMYCCHVLVLKLTRITLWGNATQSPSLYEAILIWSAVVVISLLVTAGMRRIPVLRSVVQ